MSVSLAAWRGWLCLTHVRVAGCAQMQVLMLMFAGADTSRESHKVLLGILPDLPTHILDNVREPLPGPLSLPCAFVYS
jgi:hypothetical protein